MLKDKELPTQIETGKIYGFKLATGEEIIAKVTAKNGTSVSINKPHFLTQTPEGVAFAPALTMMSDKVDPVLDRSNLIIFFEPDAQFVSAYEGAMSDIIVPDNNVIT